MRESGRFSAVSTHSVLQHLQAIHEESELMELAWEAEREQYEVG